MRDMRFILWREESYLVRLLPDSDLLKMQMTGSLLIDSIPVFSIQGDRITAACRCYYPLEMLFCPWGRIEYINIAMKKPGYEDVEANILARSGQKTARTFVQPVGRDDPTAIVGAQLFQRTRHPVKTIMDVGEKQSFYPGFQFC